LGESLFAEANASFETAGVIGESFMQETGTSKGFDAEIDSGKRGTNRAFCPCVALLYSIENAIAVMVARRPRAWACIWSSPARSYNHHRPFASVCFQVATNLRHPFERLTRVPGLSGKTKVGAEVHLKRF
jgi:hypothetical protein